MSIYSEDDEVLTEAEMTDNLRQSITKALTGYPDYCTVCVIIYNDAQRTLGQGMAQEIAEELEDQCLRQADRVLFIESTNHPLGEIKLFDNCLTIGAFKEYFTPEATERRNRERTKQRTDSTVHKFSG